MRTHVHMPCMAAVTRYYLGYVSRSAQIRCTDELPDIDRLFASCSPSPNGVALSGLQCNPITGPGQASPHVLASASSCSQYRVAINRTLAATSFGAVPRSLPSCAPFFGGLRFGPFTEESASDEEHLESCQSVAAALNRGLQVLREGRFADCLSNVSSPTTTPSTTATTATSPTTTPSTTATTSATTTTTATSSPTSTLTSTPTTMTTPTTTGTISPTTTPTTSTSPTSTATVTPTTTATTSASSTPTTTATTSPFVAGVACESFGSSIGVRYFVQESLSCSIHAAAINRLLRDCSQSEGADDLISPVVCRGPSGVGEGRFLFGLGGCATAARVLGEVAQAQLNLTLPSQIRCTLGGGLTAGSVLTCSDSAKALNTAIEELEAGVLPACSVTSTATITATTTATTTATAPTTVIASSPTTTATTTPTTSAQTTATTTATSTPSIDPSEIARSVGCNEHLDEVYLSVTSARACKAVTKELDNAARICSTVRLHRTVPSAMEERARDTDVIHQNVAM